MSDDESSDGDVPLSSLGSSKRQSRGSVNCNEDESDGSEEAEFQGDEEEEASADEGMDTDDFIEDDGEDEDDDSSDDEKPLSALKSPKAKAPAKTTPKKKAESAKKAAPKKKESSAKKAKATAKKAPPKKKDSSSSLSKSSSSYNSPSIELYTNCDKGKLIQAVLVRWWYAYTWPDPATYTKATPKNYTALDGFPGVYICTSGSDVGKFIDNRDHETAPTFKNFSKKSASELRDMLLKAIDGQRTKLIENEGEGTMTEKGLRELEKWANKLNCSKVDKEAEKVLKAAKMALS
jgi:hypothetical protein